MNRREALKHLVSGTIVVGAAVIVSRGVAAAFDQAARDEERPAPVYALELPDPLDMDQRAEIQRVWATAWSSYGRHPLLVILQGNRGLYRP